MNLLRTISTLAGVGLALLLQACSGGGGGLSPSGCTGSCQTAGVRLEVADVERILAQVIAEAQARETRASIAVVDRVGNVLAVFLMADSGHFANPVFEVGIGSRKGFKGGLDGIVLRNADAIDLARGEGPLFGTAGSVAGAIAKAVTGAYLSSEGNAFSTRTASQIVQEFFNPGETNQPGGPLFGVQFSSLPCSDLNLRLGDGGAGPKRSPLGLSADAGGFPLYKTGVLVGGLGVIADGRYDADLDISDRDRGERNLDEILATAGTVGFEPPGDRRGDRITVDGKTFRYSDASRGELSADPAAAPTFASLLGSAGALLAVPGYSAGAGLLQGQIAEGRTFGFAGSGYRDADEMPVAGPAFAGLDAFVLVDAAEQERFMPRAGTDAASLQTGIAPLSSNEVTQVLRGALGVANRARAQIRRPLDSQVRVTVSVVDTHGAILGIVRTRDAPVFGTDVSLQKARSAAFFSGHAAAQDLLDTPDANYLVDGDGDASLDISSIAGYVAPLRDAFGRSTLLSDGSIAFGARSVGNLARPFFPDGVTGNPHGPLSKPIEQWSPFSTGLQLDLVNNSTLTHVRFLLGRVLEALGVPADPQVFPAQDIAAGACTQMPATPSTPSRLANGLQIFAGGVPIYRGDTLVGAIGISGDGIDQDDMVAFLGLHEGSLALGGSIGNAPAAIRADQFTPRGVRLRYVQCPQAPFLGSDEQRVCEGK